MKRTSIALRAALVFVVFGILWILFTDLAVSALAPDLLRLAAFQFIKGVAFIVLAAALLYRFLSSQLWRRERQLEEEAQRALELRAIAELGTSALSGEDLGEVLESAAQMSVELLPYECAVVFGASGASTPVALEPRAAVGIARDEVPPASLSSMADPDLPSFAINSAGDQAQGPFIVFESANAKLHSALVSEIELPDRRYGCIALFAPESRTAGQVQRSFLRGVAHALGLAVARQRAEARLRKRADQQRALVALGNEALRSLNLQPLFERAVHVASEQLEVEFTKVLELQPDGDRLHLLAGVGWRDDLVGSATVPAQQDSQAGYTLVVEEPVVVADLSHEPRFQGPALLTEHGVVSGMSVVITGSDGPFGVFGAHTRDRRDFSPDDVAFLQSLANLLSAAVQRVRSEEGRQFQAQLLDSVGEAVIATDLEGRVRYWNPGAERVYGWSAQEALGAHITSLNVANADLDRSQEIMRTVAAGETWSGEFPVHNKQGETFPAQVTNAPIFDQQGQMIGIVGVSRDLRELRGVEAALAESEALHQLVLANIQDAVFITEETGDFRYVCSNAHFIFGYKQQEVEALGNIRALFDGELLVSEAELDQQGTVANIEVRVQDKQAEQHDLLVTVRRVSILDGTRLYTCRDVTGRVAAERALAESEARYRSMSEDVLDSSTVATFILDAEMKVQWLNQAAERYFEVERSKLVGADHLSFLRERVVPRLDAPQSFRKHVERAYRENRPDAYELHLLAANGGQERWLQRHGQPIEQGYYQGGRLEHYSDVTERKRLEGELEEALERLRLVTKTTQAALWDYHVEDDWTWRSPAYATAFGYPAESIDTSLEYWTERIHPQDRERVLSSLWSWIESGEASWTVEYRFRRADGSYAWVYDRGYALFDEQGETYRAMGSMLDISERKRYEQELAETAQRFQLFVDATNDAIWEYDFETDELWWSDNFATMFGFSPEEVGSEFVSWQERVHPADRDRVVESIEAWRASDRTQWSAEYRLRAADGSYAFVYDRAYGLRASDGTLERALGSLMDITDRKRAEKRLKRQRSRLQALRHLDEILLATDSIADMAQAALQTLADLVPSESAMVATVDPESERMQVVAAMGSVGPDFEVGATRDLTGSGLDEAALKAGTVGRLGGPEGELPEGWLSEQARAAGLSTVLSARMTAMGEPVGVLALGRKEPQAFGQEDEDLLDQVSQSLAMGIRSAKLLASEQRRAAEQESLRRASMKVSSDLELEPVLDTVAREALDLLPGMDCNIFLYENDELTFGAARYRNGRSLEPYAEPRQDGLTFSVARSGERIVVEDPTSHPLFETAFEDWRGAIAGIPLLAHNEVVGVMNLAFEHEHHFTEAELSTMEQLGEIAAIAISNARLYRSQQRQHAELTALLKVATDLSRQIELDAVLQSIVESLHESMEAAQAATVFLLDSKGEFLVAKAWAGHADEDMEDLAFPLDSSVIGDVVIGGRPRIYNDIQSQATFTEVGKGRLDSIKSLLAAPIEREGEVVGAVFADNFSAVDAFSQSDLELLKGMAAQASAAIGRAQLFERVEQNRKRLSELSRQLVEAQETEKRHLARELHDEVGQILTSLKLTLEMIEGEVAEEPGIERAIEMVAELLARVRDLSLDLRPSMLDDLGLLPAVEWLVGRMETQSTLAISLEVSGQTVRMPADVETAAYRVTQEALTNVVRHAGAQQARVAIEFAQDTLQVQVEDKGRGFDPDYTLASPGHSGVSGMRERVSLLGGRFRVQSEPAQGTLIEAEFPLENSDGERSVNS